MIPPGRFNSLARTPLRRALGLLGVFLLAAGLIACQPADDGVGEPSAPPVVEITARDYAFAAPDTIPAGWVTFRMENRGEESHHFHLDRLPEGKTFAEWQEAYQEPVDSLGQLLRAGTIDTTEAIKAHDRIVPDWAAPLETRGGVGLVTPGRTGQTTHYVDPGHYVMICVIDAPSGRKHYSLGMVAGLVVVGSSLERSPPTPDATVRLAGPEIRTDDMLASGERTIGFRVEEVPEEYRGGTDGYYSVWVARLNDTTSTRDVATWEFENPAPYESLGGFEYLPPDQTVYVTADFEPDRYAWVWGYLGMDQPLAEPFTVEDARER